MLKLCMWHHSSICESMRLSRSTRTHLIYQFIILTSIFLWIAHNEFMIDKKYVILLGLVPMFLYQIITISWFLDLLPESQRSCLSEVLFGTRGLGLEAKINEQLEKNQESKELKKDSNNPEDVGECSHKSPSADNKQRTYKFRGWPKSPNSNPPQSPPPFDATEAEKFPRFTWSSDEKNKDRQESEMTKLYFFPYRQKRPEEWIDPNGLKRPCKIKPRVSNIDEQDEESNQAADEASVMSGSPKIKKRHTFPRQKRRDINEKTEVENCTIGMPLIPNKEYLAEARNRTSRRRSMSSSQLQIEQGQPNYKKHQEFSQSVEIPCPLQVLNRTPSEKKTKSGFFNYFSKLKKENNDPKAGGTKKRTQMGIMKNLFQSRESLKMFGFEGDRNKKSEDKEGFTYYPGYSLFDTFEEKDSRKEVSETK